LSLDRTWNPELRQRRLWFDGDPALVRSVVQLCEKSSGGMALQIHEQLAKEGDVLLRPSGGLG
jgi:hypothetical protein